MTFKPYVDSKLEWRWTLTAENGEPLAVSSEGYKNKADCLHAIELIKRYAAHARIVEANFSKALAALFGKKPLKPPFGLS